MSLLLLTGGTRRLSVQVSCRYVHVNFQSALHVFNNPGISLLGCSLKMAELLKFQNLIGNLTFCNYQLWLRLEVWCLSVRVLVVQHYCGVLFENSVS